ncbi:hypothetical protein BDV27DRAFT_121653 [Aspergillus caelatus]|uniref:Uncharacterized protein n=1 Tax=Aspergillus caelatus TaxID=61420 RepID=A0A5N7AJE8_9EURO|nr:uncharacterized protein BDV27DRAFT_121653 [Aspergillus caelatus]KAE8368780.1 hypothetical protein BDV27DRAFT_121653 [Aspergillus caelatus]
MTGYPMGSSSSMLIMVLLSGVKLVGLWMDWSCFCLVPVFYIFQIRALGTVC